MATKFSLASQVALHVLKRDGPLTTHRLYRACLAEDAPAEKTYKQPGHREWRLFGSDIVQGTVPPPNPDHLVRSVKFLKQNMRELRSYARVGHEEIRHWIEACQKAGNEELLNEALVAQKSAEEEKDSPRVWIDKERYTTVLGEGALQPKSLPRKAKRAGNINPKYVKEREETRHESEATMRTSRDRDFAPRPRRDDGYSSNSGRDEGYPSRPRREEVFAPRSVGYNSNRDDSKLPYRPRRDDGFAPRTR